MKECPKCDKCFTDDVGFCPFDQTQTRFTLPGGLLLANRYNLELKLGRGAMGQVYLARDENLGKKVAVKTVRQDLLNSDDLQEGEAIARFEREARAAASIRHPHCVDVTDFGKTVENIFYLVMEYVEGETLHKLLRREGTLTVKRAVNLLAQIGEGVDAAHEAGILHRDLKPANIFLMKKRGDDDGFIKVGDFGLAKIVNQTVTDISSNATPSSRGIIGTPEFMSPEQMQPEIGVDVRADIYALGTIAYLMLGGRTPFTGDMMQLVMQKIMHTPPPLSTLRTDVPPNVERSIMHALEREADKRPSTVVEWITELKSAASGYSEEDSKINSRLVIMAPVGAEVYIDDERRGNIGSSGKIVLNNVPMGRHVLRVSSAGLKDDERVIEIRDDANEQVINAQLKSSAEVANSKGVSGSADSSVMPGIVSCSRCGEKFAEGVKYCGKCGNNSFVNVSDNYQLQQLKCPRCGRVLPQGSRFCGKCGLNMNSVQTQNQTINIPPPSNQFQPPQSVQRVCRRCNLSFLPHIKYCGRCGASLNG